jgi:cell wall-associated NlpC family hydrolase
MVLALLTVLAFSLLSPAQAYAAPTAAEKQVEVDAASGQLSNTEQSNTAADEILSAAIASHDMASNALDDARERAKVAEENIAKAQESIKNISEQILSKTGLDLDNLFLKPFGLGEFNDDGQPVNTLVENNLNIIKVNKKIDLEADLSRALYTVQEAKSAQDEEAARIKDAQTEELLAQQKAQLDALKAEADALAKKEAEELAVVNQAASRLGLPYVWGATGPNTFDCSGLTSWSYLQAGRGWIGRTDADQYANAKERWAYSSGNAKPGDVLWWPGHVAIYAGNDQYIEAPQAGDVVKYSNNRLSSATILRF